MRQIDQHLQPALDDLVRGAAVDVAHEADAAGFVLEPRIVESLSLWYARTGDLRGHFAVPR